MAQVIPSRMSAEIEGDFVVFLIGMRINKPWKIHKWLPVFLAMPSMLKELEGNRESGYLGSIAALGVIVQYWRSFEHLESYAHDHMIDSEARGCIVDYLGSHQHLAVGIDLSVDEQGGLRLRSGAQRFYEGPLGFTFPMLFSGIADVREWFDEKTQRFRIVVNVHNRTWGPLFGYRGSFDVDWLKVDGVTVPGHIMPYRQERRE
jgi:Domain of unknown function (DUF4166)/Domain of unknown function (DUF4188)